MMMAKASKDEWERVMRFTQPELAAVLGKKVEQEVNN